MSVHREKKPRLRTVQETVTMVARVETETLAQIHNQIPSLKAQAARVQAETATIKSKISNCASEVQVLSAEIAALRSRPEIQEISALRNETATLQGQVVSTQRSADILRPFALTLGGPN
jgi:cell division protein FtsL